MSKTRKCPVCDGVANAIMQSYDTGVKKRDGSGSIVVDGVEVYSCANSECNHNWLPSDQDRKIDQIIARESRYDLTPDQITMIRESLPFANKFQTAEFLCLNEKAFTKWELGYSEPNLAYDLLLRLAVFSKDTFAFIKHLHSTSFKFDPKDYELVCDRLHYKWNFRMLTGAEPFYAGIDGVRNVAMDFSLGKKLDSLFTHSQSSDDEVVFGSESREIA